MSEPKAEYVIRSEYIDDLSRAVELEKQRLDLLERAAKITPNRAFAAATLDAIDKLKALKTIMPCGHLAQYFYPPDETDDTKRFCTICELYAVSFSDDKINTYSKGPG